MSRSLCSKKNIRDGLAKIVVVVRCLAIAVMLHMTDFKFIDLTQNCSFGEMSSDKRSCLACILFLRMLSFLLCAAVDMFGTMSAHASSSPLNTWQYKHPFQHKNYSEQQEFLLVACYFYYMPSIFFFEVLTNKVYTSRPVRDAQRVHHHTQK
eukprot:4424108-Amphidinium_carterae.1